MQESTIKSNFTYMRLLCGLLLFPIIDCCFHSCRNLKPRVSLSCRGHSVFCFNSGLTVAFSLSSKLLFFTSVQSDTTKTYTFSVDIPKLFSFKTWFINKFQVIEFKPDNFRIHSLASGLFQGWDGSLESRSLSKSLWQHNRATNPAFQQKNKENVRKTAEITIKIANTEQKI